MKKAFLLLLTAITFVNLSITYVYASESSESSEEGEINVDVDEKTSTRIDKDGFDTKGLLGYHKIVNSVVFNLTDTEELDGLNIDGQTIVTYNLIKDFNKLEKEQMSSISPNSYVGIEENDGMFQLNIADSGDENSSYYFEDYPLNNPSIPDSIFYQLKTDEENELEDFLVINDEKLYILLLYKEGEEFNCLVYECELETDESLPESYNNENQSSTADSLSSTQTEETFNPDDYEIIKYEDIMRDRTGKLGTKHTFYAEVLQYFEDGDNAFAMLMRNGDSDLIYQAYFYNLPDSRLVEGDNVDVYGTLMGLQGYETVRGNENTTPTIIINKILVEGIDY